MTFANCFFKNIYKFAKSYTNLQKAMLLETYIITIKNPTVYGKIVGFFTCSEKAINIAVV